MGNHRLRLRLRLLAVVRHSFQMEFVERLIEISGIMFYFSKDKSTLCSAAQEHTSFAVLILEQ